VTGRLPARWLRVWRYTASSIIAAATSAVVFAGVYALGLGTVWANVLAFAAGAVPNWVLNRSWAWQRRGRVHVGREVVLYAEISLASLAASSAATEWASRWARSAIDDSALRVLLVAGAYVATYGVLFVGKYAVYELVVFAGDGRAPRSRTKVPSTTRPNRRP
jgi:putative flippase GtrA